MNDLPGDPLRADAVTPAADKDALSADEFELFDLRVDVVGPSDRKIYCGAHLGDYFELHGELLKLPPGQGFSIYSLAADAEVACPDPHCPTRFRITRTGRRRFKRSEVTATSRDTPTQHGTDAV